MKTIQILEDNDCIELNDWCRPLSLCTMSGGMSDSYSFKSCYSGRPENNVEWVLVKHVFGTCWAGKTVATITKEISKYEFVRGDIPTSHRLDMTDYDTTVY